MHLFLLSKENLELASAEAEALHDVAGKRLGDRLLLDAAPRDGLALTREVHELLDDRPLSNSADRPASRTAGHPDWASVVEPPFKVVVHDGLARDARSIAGEIWRSLVAAGAEPSVDLERPATEIGLFLLDGKERFARLRWRNTERFFDRRPHLRPRNHPTGLNPKLARAMINLAGPAETILDPFCGAGGILLEGAFAGRGMTGIDIDPAQIRRAEENLAHYGAGSTLTVGDATRCDALGRFDAIVTDLPLGRNAKLVDAERTFADFFRAATRVTTRIIVAIDVGFPLERCFSPEWRASASYDWYVHKGMVKRIFRLGR